MRRRTIRENKRGHDRVVVVRHARGVVGVRIFMEFCGVTKHAAVLLTPARARALRDALQAALAARPGEEKDHE